MAKEDKETEVNAEAEQELEESAKEALEEGVKEEVVEESELDIAKKQWKESQDAEVKKNKKLANTNRNIVDENTQLKAQIAELQGNPDEAKEIKESAAQKEVVELRKAFIEMSRDKLVEDAFTDLNFEFESRKFKRYALKEVGEQLTFNPVTKEWEIEGSNVNKLAKAYGDDTENVSMFKSPLNKGTSRANTKTDKNSSNTTLNNEITNKMSDFGKKRVEEMYGIKY